MRVFISWSGNLSKSVALALREWLPLIMDRVEPYVSAEDIEMGVRWFTDLSNGLKDAEFGIVCVTRENLTAPWILFEAGAIAKSVDEQRRLVPLLIDLPGADLKGPLVHFQYSSTSRADIWKLVLAIYVCLADPLATEDRLEKRFDKFWPDLEREILGATNQRAIASVETKRDPQEILEEVLDLTRTTAQAIARLDPSPRPRLAPHDRPLNWLLSPQQLRSVDPLYAQSAQVPSQEEPESPERKGQQDIPDMPHSDE